MKNQTIVLVAILVVLGCSQVLGQLDYCGKPCSGLNTLVCAYDTCFTYFAGVCAMRKYNCDNGRYFREADMMKCMLGPQCKPL